MGAPSEKTYGIGMDFGTDSVRAVLVSYETGAILGTADAYYRRWKKLRYCNPSEAKFRHHPKDYLEALEESLTALVSQFSSDVRAAVGSIAVAATGSTVCPVDKQGSPLALQQQLAEDPDCMFSLWKDHSAFREAEEFNTLCETWDTDYRTYQGEYSSEWYWAKLVHAARTNPVIRGNAWTWIELCDWIPAVLSGNTAPQDMYHSQCAAGHKALWNSEFKGLPDRKFLQQLDEHAVQVHDRYGAAPRSAASAAGTLTDSWAETLGLPRDTVIGGSSLDAHAGAVGACIRPKTLISVLGTSAVHMVIEPYENGHPPGSLRHICGMAEDSIIPGSWGIESGQAAFGDILTWFNSIATWFSRAQGKDPGSVLAYLDSLILNTVPKSDTICIDWFNGRRYPWGSDRVKGALLNLDLSTDITDLYSSIIDGILFGMKQIISEMQNYGIVIDQITATGGIARKSEAVMQRMAAVLEVPVFALASKETCALGAAMFGAAACGAFPDLPSAQQSMGSRKGTLYEPDETLAKRYRELYRMYAETADTLDAHYLK